MAQPCTKIEIHDDLKVRYIFKRNYRWFNEIELQNYAVQNIRQCGLETKHRKCKSNSFEIVLNERLIKIVKFAATKPIEQPNINHSIHRPLQTVGGVELREEFNF